MFREVEGLSSLNVMKQIKTCFMQCFYLPYTMKHACFMKQNMKESFIVNDSLITGSMPQLRGLKINIVITLCSKLILKI